MKFSDLWTGTPYTFTILTTTDDQAWDPPIFHEVKTKKGTFNFKVIIFKIEMNALIYVVDFSLFEHDVFVKNKCTRYWPIPKMAKITKTNIDLIPVERCSHKEWP